MRPLLRQKSDWVMRSDRASSFQRLHERRFWHVYRVHPNGNPTESGPHHRVQNVAHYFLSLGSQPLCGMLRRLKVHLMQHCSRFSNLRGRPCTLYSHHAISKFLNFQRYLGLLAYFVVSYCTLMSENVCETPLHFFPNRAWSGS